MATEIVRILEDGVWKTEVGAGGGGGSSPDSWLNAYVQAGITSSANLQLGENDHQGTDIEIDGDDDQLINILTAGTYTVVVMLDIEGDATGAGTVQIDIGGDIASIGWCGGGDPPRVKDTVTPPSYSSFRSFTMPNVVVSAPTTVYVALQITTGAGAITVGASGSVAVVKVG